jgi:hypothetical protein
MTHLWIINTHFNLDSVLNIMIKWHIFSVIDKVARGLVYK